MAIHLSDDRMTECEVSMRFAFHLLSISTSVKSCDVAIDGAQVRVNDRKIFPLCEFLKSYGWRMKKQSGKNPWQGLYERKGQQLNVIAQSGRGDVVAEIGRIRVRAESKKGPLVKRKGSPEYPLLREAIGQLMTVEEIGNEDILVVAVPNSVRFRNLASRWRDRPLIQKAQIHFALVGRDGSVEGLPECLKSSLVIEDSRNPISISE